MGVCGNICYVAAVVNYSVLALECSSMLYICVRNVMDVVFFCLYCDTWSSRCSCMGSIRVSSCRCCMFVSCVHPVAVLNAEFCMTCSLLMLVEHAKDDHMEEEYSRAGLMISL